MVGMGEGGQAQDPSILLLSSGIYVFAIRTERKITLVCHRNFDTILERDAKKL